MNDIVVIFAPGSGGNHLANLLSTDKRHQQRISLEKYDHLIDNAHPSRFSTFEKISEKPHVFACHFAEYLWHQHRFGKHSRFILIEFPPQARNHQFLTRIQKLYSYYDNNYLLEELSTFYSAEVFSKISNCGDITPLPVSLLFDPDSTPLIQYLTDNIDIQLDHNIVQCLHQKWIAMIETSINI